MNQGLTSVIVVAADSGPMLRDCVERVLACSAPLELIVIDNDSSDGVPEALQRALASEVRLKVVYNRANLGFGAAVNRAEEVATGDALLILNPDCLLEPDTLSRLRCVLDNHLHAGVVGAVVMDGDGTPDPASCRRDPLLRRVLATLRRRDAEEGLYVTPPWPEHVAEAEAISGALMLMPRRAFRNIEGFDEDYFLHFEDLDLCRRLRDAHYQVLLAGDVRVHHAKGTSSAHRPVFVSRHKHAGMWRWLRRYDPALKRPLTALTVWLGLWAHFLAELPLLMLKRRPRPRS
ncbi:glycosyltransferase family 2 protein [Oleiagrimonas sp. C23AA]|uniref:glycosyltransferase family 2 protein n=1 Tax=Oleiagrimonas sp. C23AA TaxID=2719047 RepID=UPI001422947E|nr:glycosyltransferase family 2 protein [Oleiagrimonas sp. C23AA]NII12073.1 glycosyltransferase family 2 protein [Oleiagrimonas sp. C23AA]